MIKEVRANDIFIVETLDFNGNIRKHFYYCIYSQSQDINNLLNEDVVGLLITTNEKMEEKIKNGDNDYNVRIKLHGKTAYVCCDKINRFNKKEIISSQSRAISDYEKKFIFKFYKRFIRETYNQLGKS